MLKEKKGQALVEFVIIFPILIMILLALIDFGKIYYVKSNLEGSMEKVIDMYNSGNTHEQIKNYLKQNDQNIKLKITNDNNEYISIELSKKVEIITPGLQIVLTDPYYASVKRVLPYE